MAKQTTSKKSHDTSVTISTPTPFGSHSSMVVSSDLADRDIGPNEVVCSDENGYYITFKNRLDTNLADPNRYGFKNNRIKRETDGQKSS